MRKYLLCLFLASCSGPDAYERGTYARPPPSTTHTPAGTGAPTPGQPGHQRGRNVPRSDDKRVLPPEERPGIWASDGDARRALVLRIQRPRPGTVPDGATKEIWTKCWADVASLLLDEPAVYFLSEKEMECLRHRLLDGCGQHFIGRLEAAQRRRDEKRGDLDFLSRWRGDVSTREWEAAMTERRHQRYCGQDYAWTDAVGRLYGPLSLRGIREFGWPPAD